MYSRGKVNDSSNFNQKIKNPEHASGFSVGQSRSETKSWAGQMRRSIGEDKGEHIGAG